MLGAYLDKINERLALLIFTGSTRIEFYRSLQLLLNNQVQMHDGLQKLYQVYSDNGKNAGHPVAVVISDCQRGIAEGKAFTEVLSKWVPIEEGMLLRAGESAGKLKVAFKDAEKIIHAKSSILGAIVGAVAYPIVLSIMTGFLFHMVATDLVPKLSRIVSPDKWTGPAKLLSLMATSVNQYGLIFVCTTISLISLLFFTLGTFRGPIRSYLDHFPPWSIYRMVHGASFLMNLSALIRSGVQLHVALEQLSAHANPWMKERLDAALAELAVGKNLGEALNSTGYDFPDKRANQFLAVIAEYSGLDFAMASFGEQWLSETVLKIQSIAGIFLMLGVACVGVTMLLVVAGVGGLQDALQTAATG